MVGSSSSKSSHSPQNPLHKEAKKPPILIMMEKLSVQLIAFRKREGLDQKQMAKLMGMGQSRYNEIEKVRNLNPEFGVSLCFLLRFAQLEKISLSALAESLQDQKPGTPSPRDKWDENLAHLFSNLKLQDRQALFQKGSEPSSSKVISPGQPQLKWLVELGLDLFSLDVKEQLQFEMTLHQKILKEKTKGRISQQQRRARLHLVMEELIHLS
jgi:transcriptional regulator with XRE-family HTH domain